MTEMSLIYPMFVLVLLSVFVMAILFRRRVAAVRQGQVSTRFFRIYQGESEPEAAAQAARHFANLFEVPVLFYAACLAAMVIGLGDRLTLALAWTYVLARLIHAIVHLGRNRLRHRMMVYMLSWVVLLALWLRIVVAVAQQP